MRLFIPSVRGADFVVYCPYAAGRERRAPERGPFRTKKKRRAHRFTEYREKRGENCLEGGNAMTGTENTDRISRLLTQAGLPLHGFCRFDRMRSKLLPCRAAARLPETAASVIVALFPYRFPEGEQPRNLSRYACVPDYHRAAGQVLDTAAGDLRQAFGQAAFEPFIDNSPIPEVYAASLAGLGCVGDNGLLIHPQFGSFVFIGTIVTDLALPIVEQSPRQCLHCGACRSRCPGRALSGEGLERSRCLSHISQKKGELSGEEQALLRENGLVWGCDACQDACPLNRNSVCRPHPCFSWYAPSVTPEDLERLEDKAYGWRGKSVPLRNWRLLYTSPDRGEKG